MAGLGLAAQPRLGAEEGKITDMPAAQQVTSALTENKIAPALGYIIP
jgi:hypothetical protein